MSDLQINTLDAIKEKFKNFSPSVVDKKMREDVTAALNHAATSGQLDILSFLLDQGAGKYLKIAISSRVSCRKGSKGFPPPNCPLSIQLSYFNPPSS